MAKFRNEARTCRVFLRTETRRFAGVIEGELGGKIVGALKAVRAEVYYWCPVFMSIKLVSPTIDNVLEQITFPKTERPRQRIARTGALLFIGDNSVK